MIQVKYVHPARLLNKKQVDILTSKYIPVVELSALRGVVEILQEVVKKNYAVWKAHAEFADDPTDHNTLHADLMKHDPIYAKAQRLLAHLDAEGVQ